MSVINKIYSTCRTTRRFVLLWARQFCLIVLITAAEGIVFCLMGFRYQSSLLPVAACPTDLSIARQGNYAALSMRMTGSLGKENWRDVVVIDLLRQDPVWLGVNFLSPHHVAIAPDANSVAIASGDGAIYSMPAPFNNSPAGGGRKARRYEF